LNALRAKKANTAGRRAGFARIVFASLSLPPWFAQPVQWCAPTTPTDAHPLVVVPQSASIHAQGIPRSGKMLVRSRPCKQLTCATLPAPLATGRCVRLPTQTSLYCRRR